jgi:hypothetical protein
MKIKHLIALVALALGLAVGGGAALELAGGAAGGIGGERHAPTLAGSKGDQFSGRESNIIAGSNTVRAGQETIIAGSNTIRGGQEGNLSSTTPHDKPPRW